MRVFYLMRHGQTLFNLRRKIQGVSDSPLTELGIKQAEAAREYFDDIEFDYLYASTSERASDTLEIATRNRMPYTRLKSIKEMNFGIYEGESEDLNPKWKDGYDMVFPRVGGESREDVKNRMREACIGIMEQDNHNTVLAVSHAGACLHFLRNWADQETIDHIFATGGFANCTILKFAYDDKKFEFLEIIRPQVQE